ncbi:MAG: radical SAM family heme chaperone HemW [Parachlamydiales bacterium]
MRSGRWGLYLHIPFCRRRCDYCHFYVTKRTPEREALLFEALHREWAIVEPATRGKELASIYFGGGTPSLASPQLIGNLLERLSPPEGIEITLEANPEDLTLERARLYRAMGINRLSLGLQTLDTPLLQQIGRTHDAPRGVEAIWAAHEAGFDNLSIDLMFDLPNQTLEQVERTLEQIAPLPITHVSLYNLQIEPPSPFALEQEKTLAQMPDDETSLAMLTTCCTHLHQMGLVRYEISAFARPGYEAVHNSGYWTGRPFLGLGPSSFSYWNRKRMRNTPNLEAYAGAIRQGRLATNFIEQLSNEKRWRELFTIGLRLVDGVDLERFTRLYGPSPVDLNPLLSEGLLTQTGTRVALTDRGRLFYDTVASELV